MDSTRLCSIDGCERRADSRGWCQTHYMRWRRNGDVHYMQKLSDRSRMSDAELRDADRKRFHRQYQVSINGCWLWTSGIADNGYGKFRVGDCTMGAHKWSYEDRHGEVPEGMHLDHLCRVRHCVNPDHLEVVTPKVNTYRGISFSAVNAAKTHCIHGHEFTPENTHVYVYKGKPHRSCRRCRVDAAKRRRNTKAKRTTCQLP